MTMKVFWFDRPLWVKGSPQSTSAGLMWTLLYLSVIYHICSNSQKTALRNPEHLGSRIDSAQVCWQGREEETLAKRWMDLLDGIQRLPLRRYSALNDTISTSSSIFLESLVHFCGKWLPGMTQKSQNEATCLCTVRLQYSSVDRTYIQHTQSLFAEIIKFSKDARRRNT